MTKESVWGYPRPPAVEQTARRIRVEFGGRTVADTINAYRVLETSHPPAYYVPQQDVAQEMLVATERITFCEFKGSAGYFDVVAGREIARNAAWSYPSPAVGYEVIAGYVAFYPSLMDGCFVDDERVVAQPGHFYGGWITSDIEGPFKG